jgi:hypothetical protein
MILQDLHAALEPSLSPDALTQDAGRSIASAALPPLVQTAVLLQAACQDDQHPLPTSSAAADPVHELLARIIKASANSPMLGSAEKMRQSAVHFWDRSVEAAHGCAAPASADADADASSCIAALPSADLLCMAVAALSLQPDLCCVFWACAVALGCVLRCL